MVLDSETQKLIGVGVGALCAGFGLGYLIGSRRKQVVWTVHENSDVTTETDIEVFVDEDGKEVRPTSSMVLTPNPNPAGIEVDHDAVDELEELIHAFGLEKGYELYRAKRDDSESEEPEKSVEKVVNVFAGSDQSWDYEKELANRSPGEPYTIHMDEFFAEESGYSQSNLTYYRKDDILTDSEDVPVYNYKNIVGELRFGQGTNDPNAFYVRNDKLKAEYEVIQDDGSYAEEVLGLDAESDPLVLERGPLKFPSDE